MTDSIDTFFDEWARQRRQSGLPPLPADVQYIYRIARISHMLGRRLDHTCSEHGLTRSQYEAMAVMRRCHPRPLSAGELMNAALLTSGSVTAMLNQLLTKGLVQRAAHQDDKRRIQVWLTPAGLEKIDGAIQDRIRDNTTLAHLLPKSERDTINQVLKQCLTAMEALDQPQEPDH